MANKGSAVKEVHTQSEISQPERETSTIWLHSYVESNEKNELPNKIETESRYREKTDRPLPSFQDFSSFTCVVW